MNKNIVSIFKEWRDFLSEKTRLDKEIEKTGKKTFKTVKGEVDPKALEKYPDLIEYLRQYARPKGQEEYMLHYSARKERPAFQNHSYKNNIPGLYGWGLDNEFLDWMAASTANRPAFAGERPYIFLIKMNVKPNEIMDLIDKDSVKKSELKGAYEKFKSSIQKDFPKKLKFYKKEAVDSIFFDSDDAVNKMDISKEEKIKKQQSITGKVHKDLTGRIKERAKEVINNILPSISEKSFSESSKILLQALVKDLSEDPKTVKMIKPISDNVKNFLDLGLKNHFTSESESKLSPLLKFISDYNEFIGDLDKAIERGKYFAKDSTGTGDYGDLDRDTYSGTDTENLYKLARRAESLFRGGSEEYRYLHTSNFLMDLGYKVRRSKYGNTSPEHADEFTVLDPTAYDVIKIFKNPSAAISQKQQRGTAGYVGKGEETKEQTKASSYYEKILHDATTSQIEKYYNKKIKQYDKPLTHERVLMRHFIAKNQNASDNVLADIVKNYFVHDTKLGHGFINILWDVVNNKTSAKNFQASILVSALMKLANELQSGAKRMDSYWYDEGKIKELDVNKFIITAFQNKEFIKHLSKDQAGFRSMLQKLYYRYKEYPSFVQAAAPYARGETSSGNLLFESNKVIKIKIKQNT